jgi:nucleoside-diphosphate-sugar epimerase
MPGTVIRTVALIGANGKVGPAILQALLDTKSFEVTVISRKSSKSTHQPASVKFEQVDDSLPHAQLVDTLRGQDALVIAFAGSQITENSIKLADAAFEAGVKHIIPADYGSCDSSDPKSLEVIPLYKGKKEVREHLIGLSQRPRPDIGSHLTWTSLITGHFFDYGLKSGLLAVDVEEHKARVFDGGDIRFSATTLADIGLATARILERVGDARLSNKLVYVQSLATTQNELIEKVEDAMGSKFEVEQVSSDEYIKEQKGLLTGDDRKDGDAILELVSVEGTVNADWEGKGDLLVNDVLGIPKRGLDQLVMEALQ